MPEHRPANYALPFLLGFWVQAGIGIPYSRSSTTALSMSGLPVPNQRITVGAVRPVLRTTSACVAPLFANSRCPSVRTRTL